MAAFAVLAIAAVAAGTGCTRVRLQDRPETRTVKEDRSVALEGAKSLRAQVRMGVGELTLSSEPSSTDAMRGSFTYTPASWKPEVDYRVSGGVGELAVRQPENTRIGALRDATNIWDVRLGGGVPVRLDLQLGVGRSDIDLRGMDVTDLRVRTGVGDTVIDLSGPRTGSTQGSIEAGVGSLLLKLPKDVGVRVTAQEKGVGNFNAVGLHAEGGAWVNDAYDGAGPKIEIEVKRGVGDVTIEVVD